MIGSANGRASGERNQNRETEDEFYPGAIPRMVKKENAIAIAVVYHPRILLSVTVRWVRKSPAFGTGRMPAIVAPAL
jgi:hypothetical protein